MTTQEISFEKAFERLEAIVQIMNSGKIALEESLKLYEEAAQLIAHCEKILAKAEKKIEMLVKTPSGTLETKPMTKEEA